MKPKAIIITGGTLHQSIAKTAHGLIRTTSRYEIVGVIDKNSAGRDAGEVVDKIHRGIPVYADIKEFIAHSPVKADNAIIGVAFPGGILPKEIEAELKEIISAKISIVSGLHDFLAEKTELRSIAELHGVKLLDIRKPRPRKDLRFWTGEILNVKCPVIGVLGTDCALGKRTTSVMITEKLKAEGVNAHMIFTGQTGWLQGHKYGFILDSTYNDFISGELEHAIVSCYSNEDADVIFVEGQSALSNPSGPCGAEYLLSANCKAVILQHSPARVFYEGLEETGIKISLRRDMDIIASYGCEVIALTLNTAGLSHEEALASKRFYEKEFDLPVILPIEEGMEDLGAVVKTYMEKFSQEIVTH